MKERAMTRFRTFVSLSAVIVALMQQAPVSAQPPPGFAYVSGRHFFVNSTRIYFGGDNIYWLGLKVMGTQPSEVDSEMANCVAAGVKVVRTWAFSYGTADSLETSLGVYNEA